MRRAFTALLLSLGLLGAAPFPVAVLAAGPAGVSGAHADYGRADSWVCRPGRRDACSDDLASTVIAADGATRVEKSPSARDPQIDCFYVYPTVSHAPGVSAPLAVSEDERRAVRQQVARLRSVCRVFAPAYRQVTATSMNAGMAGHRMPGGEEAGALAYRDVRDAWAWYLAHDNHGRGVVLIGHSQGASHLRALIQQEIDGKPAQQLLVSAILPGYGVTVAKGRDVGGTFQSVPACRRRGQTGCIIAYNTFRAGELPAQTSMPAPDGQEALCVNPAALEGGAGALKPYLSATGATIIPDLTAPQPAWGTLDRPLATAFVTLPGLLEGACVRDARGVGLYVTVRRRPGDKRAGDFVGDWMFGGVADPQMGLHLIDIDLVMGNLVEVIQQQSWAYTAQAATRAP